MTTAYKLDPAYLDARMSALKEQVGTNDVLPIFVEQTRKVLASDRLNYRRYGPYWWAMKRVLHEEGIDIGAFEEPAWADVYFERDASGNVDRARTLLAAWEFGDDNMEAYGVQSNVYDIDDTTFQLYDPDQEERDH
ncbi:hypothetical protein [Paraburkholderia sp. J10-1]|uniref:hypothetical protein n=1 Tax=Paraburkholderia sp. J10-1 TaxID=2805430 RepID=UPI002AB7A7E9|nr:hypothetical protein [Paraburkholderia sp. J10-1]